MRIIVEGADGTGKSTLVNFLAEKYNCDIIHMTRWGSRKYHDYESKLLLNDIILDRSFMSEMIYKHAFGLKPQLSFGQFHSLIEICKTYGWKFIILTGETNFLKQRLVDRGDEEPDIITNIGLIDHLYRIYAKSCDLPIFDVQNPLSLEDILEEIEK